jgi:hypothetical protein
MAKIARSASRLSCSTRPNECIRSLVDGCGRVAQVLYRPAPTPTDESHRVTEIVERRKHDPVAEPINEVAVASDDSKAGSHHRLILES